ncbi:hypothetical protein ACFV4G_13300 [Kitasatospora sp. NPDC059747]|uniref:hypothetical protein n=1 Tax=Kitasatospora sp. NPDC059747 TaxID=3346930 RepID=UPI0036620232
MRIREPDPGGRGWWRRRLPALALVWAVVAALAVVPVGLGAVPEARADSAKTVQGPKVWIPEKKGYGPEGSVTVSQTENLTNQVLQVSWSGFTPTRSVTGKPVIKAIKDSEDIAYAVRIYECKGENPLITDCYGSTLYGGEASLGFEQKARPSGLEAPELRSNMVIAATGQDGSGAASIEVWNKQQSVGLGCDAANPCSLVVEPNYGGDPIDYYKLRKGQADCEDHRMDVGSQIFKAATDSTLRPGMENWKTRNRSSEQCAWGHHVVVPLHFAPTPDDCAAAAADLRAQGLEMANRAMQQWRSGLCLGSSPLTVQYASAGGEPQARTAFFGGTTDVALTARPDQSPPARPYVYAPLTTTGISVVFAIDDRTTGRQIRDLRLNARLLAKLLTQSYDSPGDPIKSVAGNPTCLFTDPEFIKLNPQTEANGIHWPTSCGGILTVFPSVAGGTTDLTYQVTSWIASDPEAARFLDGEPDPWGMRIDTFYLRPQFPGYPVEAFQPQDFTGPGVSTTTVDLAHWKQYEWNPSLLGLSRVARNILEGKPTCQQPNSESDGRHLDCPVQAPGERALLAIMDAGQAKAFSMPEAALLNPAGAFVAPERSGFQAAVAGMTVDAATGVQQLPYGAADTAYSRDQKAYPLTTVQYAMVPTSGVPEAKAGAIANFLKSVTNGGQVYGIEPGQLAPGFLALTAAQRAQAQDAAAHVAAQDGKLPGNQAAPPNPPAVAGGTSGGGATSAPAGGSGGSTPVSDNGPAGGTAPDGTGTGSGRNGTATDGSTAAGTGAGAPAAAAPPAAGAKPTGTPTAKGPLSAAPVAAGTPLADRSGLARLLLPVALIAGLVLVVGGPAALLLGGTPAGDKAVAAVRRGWSRLRRRP